MYFPPTVKMHRHIPQSFFFAPSSSGMGFGMWRSMEWDKIMDKENAVDGI